MRSPAGCLDSLLQHPHVPSENGEWRQGAEKISKEKGEEESENCENQGVNVRAKKAVFINASQSCGGRSILRNHDHNVLESQNNKIHDNLYNEQNCKHRGIEN